MTQIAVFSCIFPLANFSVVFFHWHILLDLEAPKDFSCSGAPDSYPSVQIGDVYDDHLVKVHVLNWGSLT